MRLKNNTTNNISYILPSAFCTEQIDYINSYLSCRVYWISRSLKSMGSYRFAYSIAFWRGNPLEKNAIRQSHTGHSTTGLLRIVSSEKTTILMFWCCLMRERMLCIGGARVCREREDQWRVIVGKLMAVETCVNLTLGIAKQIIAFQRPELCRYQEGGPVESDCGQIDGS